MLFKIKRVVLSIFSYEPNEKDGIRVRKFPTVKPDTDIQASATVEASFVLPIFIVAYFTVMQLLWVLAGQMGILTALYDTGTVLATVSTGLEGHKYVSAAGAAALFYEKLDKDYIERSGIAGKSAGITLLQSDIEEDMSQIYLRADYVTASTWDMFGLFLHNYTQTLYFRGWVGVNELHRGQTQESSTELVYVTDYGEVYHIYKDCSYLNPTIKQTTVTEALQMRNESGAAYKPCKSCYSNTQMVYVTDYGGAYHSNRNCSGLKRGIMVTDKENVGAMRLCSKCSKR